MATFTGLPGVPTTSVPPIQFTPEGVILPAEGDILAGAQIDMNYSFGGGVNPALETPQGQICSSETAIIADKNSQIALICNQVDPQYSDGRFQDAIARIYFLNRKGAAPTIVTCDLAGPGGTVPAATLAQDTNGNTYTLLGDVVIPAGSAASSTWANLATGPIPCPAGTLSKVYQAVPGWDTITNPSDGALGRDVETRAEFEFRRQNSVAKNSRGTVPAIYANVFETVDGVLDVYAIDNPKGFVVNKGATNYPMLAHSLFVAVLGGEDADIAQAIWDKKSDGCDYNGNTSVTVTDPSGYNFPPPSYEVLFERPAPLEIKFQVQIANSTSLPPNLTELVQAAIMARFFGTDNTSRERIGSTVLASRYYSAVSLAVPTVVLVGIQVGTTVANAPSQPVGIDQYPTVSDSDITVVLV